MRGKEAWQFLCLIFLISLTGGQQTERCCQRKTVPGGSMAGTYNLVPAKDKVPDICIGGCVYSKESDPLPGTQYCFKVGEGEVTCSNGGCAGGDVEGWVENYFEKHCSREFNSVLMVRASSNYDYCQPYYSAPSNITMEVFDNPACEGIPLQEKLSEEPRETFLLRVENTQKWSVRASNEGYETVCQDIGIMIPYQSNYAYVYLRKDVKIVPTASIDFTYDTSYELEPEVSVQSTPHSCTNSSVSSRTLNTTTTFTTPGPRHKKKRKQRMRNQSKDNDYDFYLRNPAKARQWGSGSGSGCWGGSGSGSGSGGWQNGCNWKCRPTCQFNAYYTDPTGYPCNCRGVVGTGINYTYQDTGGSIPRASAKGEIIWYDDEYFFQDKYFITFAEFIRRDNSENQVCNSNLSLTWSSPNKPESITKNVPCFTKPISRKSALPTFPDESVKGKLSEVDLGSSLSSSVDPSGIDSGSSLPWPSSYPHWLVKTKDDYKDMFTETEDVLIWGGGDRFWIIGCMAKHSKDDFITLDVEFFTIREPRATPEFCGCIVNTLPEGASTASKEHVIACYDMSLHGGPAPWRRRGTNKRKRTRAKRRRMTRKGRKGIRRPSKTIFQQNKPPLKTLKRIGRQIKEGGDVRFNVGAFNEEPFDDNDYADVDSFEDEDDEDEDDESSMSSGWD